ncbi:hypothetical protein AC579_5839 [Pseudocercospora musae]|uniref:Uncharacterized protein n=1 Tax=Pseudocercospora musae TaxID=113226 RepID=A0A139ILU5_9PEZI|nr:hypothetical protein AC579_5839 [Pseudocercospora musae]
MAHNSNGADTLTPLPDTYSSYLDFSRSSTIADSDKKSTQKSKVQNGPTSNKFSAALDGSWSATSSVSNITPSSSPSSSGQVKKTSAQAKPTSQQDHFRILGLPTELRKIVFDFYMEGARSPRQNIVVVEHEPSSKYHNRPELYQTKPDQDYKKKDKKRRK